MNFATKTQFQRTDDRERRTAVRRPSSVFRHRAFTLIELIVAISILGMVFFFAGAIFKAGIGSYRSASGQAEIMAKLRVITQQLDSDFQGLQKDGYLVLRCEDFNRMEYPGAALAPFRADRMYYFSTGDFQSWFDPDIRSNIARIYLGHERLSLDAGRNIPVNHWRLAHDVLLLSTVGGLPDINDVNYAWCKVHPIEITEDANLMLDYPPAVDMSADLTTIRRLLCENAGKFAIDWTDGYINPANGEIVWFGLSMPRKVGDPGNGIPADANYYAIIDPIEPIEPATSTLYKAVWQPSTSQSLWPKAIRFTFTLYDSKGVFKEGQTFTHIVYLGE